MESGSSFDIVVAVVVRNKTWPHTVRTVPHAPYCAATCGTKTWM